VADGFFQECSMNKEMQTTEKLSIQWIVLSSGWGIFKLLGRHSERRRWL